MEEIIWSPISGYEDLYKISNTGKIISLHKRNRNYEISQRIDRAGYNTVRLSKNGENATKYIHRLIAYAFIPPVEGKLFVNHVNGDKLDNRIENLEWVTFAENMQHAYKIGLIRKIEKNPTNLLFKQTG